MALMYAAKRPCNGKPSRFYSNASADNILHIQLDFGLDGLKSFGR